MNRTAFVLLPLFAACAGITQVTYSPQPTRIADPRAELSAFIKQNTVNGCIAEPEFQGATLDVKFVCSTGLGHVMARLDRAKAVSVEQSGEWYRVVLHHSTGIDDFTWSSKSLEDVERAADAFAALMGPDVKPPHTQM